MSMKKHYICFSNISLINFVPVFLSDLRYTVKVSIENPLSTTSYLSWKLMEDRIPNRLLQLIKSPRESRISFVVKPGSTVSKEISFSTKTPDSTSNSQTNQEAVLELVDRLRNAIGFTATSGPWKSQAFLNVKEMAIGDLYLNTGSSEDLPVVALTVSRISK